MPRFLVEVHFNKLEERNLIIKIKLRTESNWHFFKPEHQVTCLHVDKFKNVNDFIKYRTLVFNLTKLEFEIYFNLSENVFEFKNEHLLSEENYRSLYLNFDRTFLMNHFSSCIECDFVNLNKKLIRKRKKLTDNEKLDLAHDIGMGYSQSALSVQYNLSKESIRKFKNRLNKTND